MEIKFQIPRNDVLFTPKPKSHKKKSGKKNKFLGVRQRPSGKWVAEIKNTTQKIRMWLGTFDTAEEAARAYDEAAFLLRGSNTRKNFNDHCPPNSPISLKIKNLLNLKRSSKQNPTTNHTKRKSLQKNSHVLPVDVDICTGKYAHAYIDNSCLSMNHYPLPVGFHQNLGIVHEESSMEMSSQTSNLDQCYSQTTSPSTNQDLGQDLKILDDDAYKVDLRHDLDGDFQLGHEFGDAFYQVLCSREEILAPISCILGSETSENQFSEFDRMKVERQISASLYAMNGVNEYWQNSSNNISDSLWDLPMMYQMFCSN